MTTLISKMYLTRESDSPEEQLDKLHNIQLNSPLWSLRTSMATRVWQPEENGNSFKIVILAILFFSFGKMLKDTEDSEGGNNQLREHCWKDAISSVKEKLVF